MGPPKPPSKIHHTIPPNGSTTREGWLETPNTTGVVHLTHTIEYPDADPRAGYAKNPAGTTGWYEVRFILGNPGECYYRDELSELDIAKQARTLVSVFGSTVPEGAPILRWDDVAEEGTKIYIEFVLNAQKTLSEARTRVEADSFVQAHQIAYDFVMPRLSEISFHLNIGIEVTACFIREEKTGSRKFIVGVLGQVKDFSRPAGGTTPELRLLLSSYREAMNATNPFYQFLCLYRIVEAVNHLRARRAKRANRTGLTISSPANERITKTEDSSDTIGEPTEDFFGPYDGMEFSAVIESMKDVIRHAIAHGILPSEQEAGSLVADRFEDVRRCRLALPVMRHMARILIHNEMMEASKERESPSANQTPDMD